MMKRWNVMRKMMVCSLAAAAMVMIGTGFSMTASAEMVIDNEEELQEVLEIVPESENMDVLQADAPAAQEEVLMAGEMEEEALLDVTQIVTIEENMIPGAARPEFELEGDVQAEAENLQDAEEPQEMEEPQAQEAKSETCVSGTITYEDSEVAVTVVVSEEAQLPANTEVKVTKLEEGSEAYEAAKAAACQGIEADENAAYTFYDVTLESEGQALDVADRTVSVWMEFKADADDVVSIEETESGKVARNVTDTETEGKTGSVALSY